MAEKSMRILKIAMTDMCDNFLSVVLWLSCNLRSGSIFVSL